ncbi:MAG: MMPL family transporter, partial [Chitinophagaceae bacterium]|nr:MMPL family transporter [Chitinophagaceae bacterium]
MAQFFTGLYHYFFRHKWQAYLLFFTILGISAFFALKLKFEEDISRILPKDKKVEKLNHIFQHSKFMDKLVVMVSLKDTAVTHPDSLIAFGDQFSLLVEEKLSPYVSKVNYKLDDELTMNLFDVIHDHLPVYLTEKDYLSIDSLIEAKAVKNTLAYNIRTLSSPAGFALKNIIQHDPVGISFIALKKLQQLQYDENFELYDNAVVTRDHKNLLIFLTPVYPPNNTGKNTLFLHELDRLIAEQTAAEFPAISVSYFGATAVSAGNAAQLQRDSLFTQAATVILLILFIGFYFRRVAAPVLIMIPVVFGALFSLMMVYFIQGSISIIAIGTGSVILGIAVNYSLHVFNHYRHTRDMRKVIDDLAFPLTLGGFTTIGGFFCLSFAASDMLKDLGLFAGFSLIGASLCSLIFLPHFLAVSSERKDSGLPKHSWIDRIAMLRPDRNRSIIIGIVILTIIFSYTSRKVAFETELNNMNYMSANLKAAEKKLNRINEAALQSVYLVADGKTLDEALVHNEELLGEIENFKSKNLISRYSGVHPLLISDSLQRLRIARWNQYWAKEKKQQLLDLLKDEGKQMGYSSKAFGPFEKLLNKSFQPVDSSSVDVIRKTLLNDYITEDSANVTVVTLLKVPSENKQVVYTAFEDHPNATILDRQLLTGKFVELINVDFTYIAFITSLLVFFVLLITYGRIELTLMAFLPMAISWVWIIGIMGLLGIKFNIINIIVSTLIFGLGDDYSIFIMDGLLQEYKTGKKNLSSFKSSIILSAVTTITGLGVLIFAKHPALRSIAMISVIGILSVVLVAQVGIPFLFQVLIRNRIQKNYFPWTLWGFLKTL